MRRVARPSREPAVLREYRENHPKNTWPQFCNETRANHEVFDALAKAQGGLCAWCELDIVPNPPLYDVQVEHVLAKSKSAVFGRNLHLEFENMVAACEGGTNNISPYHIDRERHLKPIKRTQHCGQCERKDQDGARYLDPRDLPEEPCLWQVDPSDGSFRPDPESCALAGVEYSLASETVDRLGLDRQGLRRQRQKLLMTVEKQVETAWAEVPELEFIDVICRTVGPALLPGADGRLSAFWSTLRSYAGPGIDDFLRAQGVLSTSR